MKLEAKQVRMLIPFLPSFRVDRLWFVGNRNTLQLLETALVIEGYRMRFFFPLLDHFFRQPLSEWTTLTVPYSRILRFQYAPRILLRVLVTALLCLPIGLSLFELAFADPKWDPASGAFLAPLVVLILVLTLYCNFRMFASRNYLWYRQSNGRRAVLVFRIRSRKMQQAFEQQLQSYLQATRTRGGQPMAEVKE
jgi:hypothetical protein